jgi:hypothetical protein
MTDGLRGELVWHRGQVSEGGACVEVASAGDAVIVRSSAAPDVSSGTLSHSEWQGFLAEVKEGLFDSQ